jgi:DNA-binding transcriptional MerR regulator
VLQLLAIKGLQVRGLPLAGIQERLYGRSDAELTALIEALQAEPVEAPVPPAVSLREVTIEPGLRLLVEEGYRPGTEAEMKIRAALAALARDPEEGRGGSA